MPNWCECNLLIEGPAERVRAFLAQASAASPRDFDFNRFIPYPEKYRRLDEAAANWDRDPGRTGKRPPDGYNSGGKEWRLEHWGTKWNAHRVTVDEPQVVDNEARVAIHFSTPRTAPTPVVLKGSKMYPELRMDLCYFEEAEAFTGRLVCKGGKVLFNEYVTDRTLRAEAEELWQSICADPSVPPEDRLDAFDEAIRDNAKLREDDACRQATQEKRGGQSCQTFPGREPGSMVVVGWDRQLESYFGQVWKEGGGFGSEHPCLDYWIGFSRRQVPSVFALAALMRGFAKIPAATLSRLLHEPVRQEPPGGAGEIGRHAKQHKIPAPQCHHPKLSHEL